MTANKSTPIRCRRCYHPLGLVVTENGKRFLRIFQTLPSERVLVELSGSGRVHCPNCGEVRRWSGWNTPPPGPPEGTPPALPTGPAVE